MPSLIEDYFENPTGFLGTIKCAPWHYQDKALILGDAAHAIVPFHGQGMNCAFEDTIYLAETWLLIITLSCVTQSEMKSLFLATN